MAEGGGDAYFFENTPESRNLRATDIAAVYRILAEAGGGMWDVAREGARHVPPHGRTSDERLRLGGPRLRRRHRRGRSRVKIGLQANPRKPQALELGRRLVDRVAGRARTWS